MNSTVSGTIKGMDFTGMFLGALMKPIRAQLDTWAWLKWPYWHEVIYIVLGLIVFYILFWFWANWIR